MAFTFLLPTINSIFDTHPLQNQTYGSVQCNHFVFIETKLKMSPFSHTVPVVHSEHQQPSLFIIFVSVWACVCVCVCVRARVCVYLSVSVSLYPCVFDRTLKVVKTQSLTRLIIHCHCLCDAHWQSTSVTCTNKQGPQTHFRTCVQQMQCLEREKNAYNQT